MDNSTIQEIEAAIEELKRTGKDINIQTLIELTSSASELAAVSRTLYTYKKSGWFDDEGYKEKPVASSTGLLYTNWYLDKSQSAEVLTETEPDYEEVELPASIVSKVFNRDDVVFIYISKKAHRIILSTLVDTSIFGDDIVEVGQVVIPQQFNISFNINYITEVGIKDVKVAILDLPDSKKAIALLGDPLLEKITSKTYKIESSVVIDAGWEIGDRIYLYINKSIREMLLAKTDNVVFYVPSASYTVRKDGTIRIPMKYIAEVDLIDSPIGIKSLSTSTIPMVVLFPDTPYHRSAYNNVEEHMEIERSSDPEADFDPDAIPF